MPTEADGHNTPVRAPLSTPETTGAAADGGDATKNKIATVALVGIGAALIETELIPGIIIGVAAMMVPDLFPKLGRAFRPLFKQTVRAGYAVVERTRESVAEVSEQVQDIVAEVKTEHHHAGDVPVGHNEEAPATGTPAV